jgi:NhaP-type Na+/H+ or K+/H+ antiporter
LQEKLELYLLGLAFTLLGLSIQTAKFAGPPPQRIAELVGWVLMLISGVVGILRLRWVPVLLRHGATIQDADTKIFQAREAPPESEIKYEAQTISVHDYIEAHQKTRAALEASIPRLSERIISMGKIQTWALIAGVCAVAAARAYVPVREIIAEYCR